MTATSNPSPAAPIPLISLTTDFGTFDTCVAQMKGVIAGIAPQANVIDGTHDIPPQDVLAGALALEAMVEAFPAGTIHVAVVDPGVGSDRAAVAVRTQRFTLVGPDNGLFTLALQHHPPTAIISLTHPAYHRAPVSPTFHGRDIFAPAAAHLASGVALQDLGESVSTLVNLNVPEPVESQDSLIAIVLRADRFGNLVTNLTRECYDDWLVRFGHPDVAVSLNRQTVGPIRATFADAEPGKPLAYFGSSNRLEIAVRNADAASLLSVTRGDRLTLTRA